MRPYGAACEGILDQAVLERVARESGLEFSWVQVAGGKAALDSRLGSFVATARSVPFLVLRDLDLDAACAPALVQRLVPHPTSGFRLHVAVHKIEAWLLADREGIAGELGVPASRLPLRPDDLSEPRAEILALARRSRRARVTLDLLPSSPGARVGAGYTARFVRFVAGAWNPNRARARSPSLDSLLRYLERSDA